MDDVISQYQRWKEQGEGLRTKARQAMEARFKDLLTEAIRIAEEYRADFGAPLKPPPQVTAFRYKSGKSSAKTKSGAAAAAPAGAAGTAGRASGKSAPAAVPAAAPRPAKPDPKIAALEKRLAATRKKLEAARAKGSATQNLEDRIYEIEDDLRILRNPE